MELSNAADKAPLSAAEPDKPEWLTRTRCDETILECRDTMLAQVIASPLLLALVNEHRAGAVPFNEGKIHAIYSPRKRAIKVMLDRKSYATIHLSPNSEQVLSIVARAGEGSKALEKLANVQLLQRDLICKAVRQDETGPEAHRSGPGTWVLSLRAPARLGPALVHLPLPAIREPDALGKSILRWPKPTSNGETITDRMWLGSAGLTIEFFDTNIADEAPVKFTFRVESEHLPLLTEKLQSKTRMEGRLKVQLAALRQVPGMTVERFTEWLVHQSGVPVR